MCSGAMVNIDTGKDIFNAMKAVIVGYTCNKIYRYSGEDFLWLLWVAIIWKNTY